MKSLKARRTVLLALIYVILGISAIIWVLPIIWIVLQSFAGDGGAEAYFIPKTWTVKNYAYLFGFGSPAYAMTSSMDGFFVKWLMNTLIVACCCCVISTFFVLATAYSLSRFRFKGRNTLMKLNLILGMFPGFLGMIILYWVMKSIFHLQGSFWALVIIYSAGSGMGFFISKGFFDTISRSIDEAAMIDGASRSQIFWHIILPLAKPIVVYTILTSFMAPWGDYITSSYIIGLQNSTQWTVAIGLYKWATQSTTLTPTYYTQYAAGSVVVSIPMIALFMATQRYYVGGVTGGAVKG
ncbi:MAG: sugar ABC transporter permease [Bacilli bacterium]|jgi:arabinogalactan oligomer/maltooligosaccharide transport system permease protein|nr:sugar ABC transporter permease [Bacilli bacterium]